MDAVALVGSLQEVRCRFGQLCVVGQPLALRYATDVGSDIHDPELRGVLARYARWHVVGRAQTNRHGHITAAVAGRCRGNHPDRQSLRRTPRRRRPRPE